MTTNIQKSEIATLADAFITHVDIRDRRHCAILYKNCFVGSEAVDVMLYSGMAATREQAVQLGVRLGNELRLFRHVRGDHPFQDKRMYYRLKIPDSIKEVPSNIFGVVNRIQVDSTNERRILEEKAQVFFRLADVRDRSYRWKKYRSCFVGCEMVDRMVYSGLSNTRWEAVQLGRALAKTLGLFENVNGKRLFADEMRFFAFGYGVLNVINDLQSEKLGSVVAIVQHDEVSVVSAPEMNESNDSDISRRNGIASSNSFDTFDTFIKKHAALPTDADESVWTEYILGEDHASKRGGDKLDEAFLGNDDELDDDSALQFTVFDESLQQPPPPPELGESTDESPRTVTDFKIITPYTNHLPTKSTGETDLSLMSIPKPRLEQLNSFSTILVDANADADDDMTQITFDNFLAPYHSENFLDRTCFFSSVNHEGSSRNTATTATTGTANTMMDRHNSTCNHSQCNKTESSTSSLLSSDTPKHRITEVLRKDLWSPDVAVVCAAMEELRKYITTAGAEERQHRAYVVQCGGVMALIRVMEQYLQNERIQFYGCISLEHLSYDCETRSAICEMDGIPLVVRSMTTHSHSAPVQDAARAALASICRRG